MITTDDAEPAGPHRSRRPSLSVCLLAYRSPGRVAVALGPVRPLADEIVIAVDSGVDDATLRQYAALADHAFSIDFRMVERHMAWLFGQCSCDWILRMDDDEVPSAAFVERLPDLLASRRVQQYWTRNAWLYGHPSSYLAGEPYASDFVTRIMKNDGTVRVRGVRHLHADRVAPLEYLDEPFYHLDLLLSDEAARRDKAILYETDRPGLLALGGGRLNEALYLPELRPSVTLRPVAEADLPTIERALAGTADGLASGSLEHVRRVTLAEMDRFWEGRSVSADVYRAKIESLEARVVVPASAQHMVYLRVANDGSELWPSQLDADPPIRLAYRLLDRAGKPFGGEGLRSAFVRAVGPGEEIITPLHMNAPAVPGKYTLEVDIVHENVRWFDCACRIPLVVGEPDPLPPSEPRLKPTPLSRLKRPRVVRIPTTLHRIGLGPGTALERRRGTSEWTTRVWTDIDLAELNIGEAELARARDVEELSFLARYEILARHGGVFVDVDLDPPEAALLRGIDAFAVLEGPGVVGAALLGAVPNHHVFVRAARLARQALGRGAKSPRHWGPYLLNLIIEQDGGVAIFDSAAKPPR